jgi:uncharacterized membrane protein
MDIYLAQLFGIYFVIIGILSMVRRKSMAPKVRELVGTKSSFFLYALIELAIGLALVVSHPPITASWVGLLSLIGWMMVIESILFLSLPSKLVQKFVGWFNRPGWYIAGGALSVALGGYLVFTGFGLV